MDHSIISERFIGLSNGTAAVIAELVAASSEDVLYYSEISGDSSVRGQALHP